jgi:hypothetical protein
MGLALVGDSDPFELVPTTRRRHFVTETDELTEALDEAARRWLSQPKSAATAF